MERYRLSPSCRCAVGPFDQVSGHVRLLSAIGPTYVAGELADYRDQRMIHVWGAPLHPQTRGKIERC